MDAAGNRCWDKMIPQNSYIDTILTASKMREWNKGCCCLWTDILTKITHYGMLGKY